MLGLAEQVGGDPVGVGAFVGHHENLRWSGDGIDTNRPENLALGLGDIGIAGADNLVDRRKVSSPESEGGDGLGAADRIKFIHTRLEGGIGNRRGELAARRGRGHHDAVDTGNLGWNRVHQHRARIGGKPARHIDADAVQRRPLPAELDA